MNRREFQFIDGSSKKFWAIALDGNAFTVHFGRIGTIGQAKPKAFGNDDTAKQEYDKLILEKTRNGYVEVAPGAASPGPAPVPRQPAVAPAAPVAAADACNGGDESADAIDATPLAKPTPAPPASTVAAPQVPPLRHVKLTDEDRQRVRWLPREPVNLPPPLPFSFDACLEQMKSALDDADNFYTVGKPDYRYMIAQAIPPRLTKEEAWLWLNVLDTPNDERERVVELARQVAAAGLPDNARARARAELAARRSDYICPIAPQTLRQFFTPIEIAELIMANEEGVLTSAMPYGGGTVRPMLAFSRLVVPQMSEEERNHFRGAMERMCDAVPDPSSAQAALRLAFLSTVGGGERLAAWVASQPDGAWTSFDWYCLLPSGYLDVLAGLPDEASFVRETRRLSGRLHRPSDLRLWLAATEWRELDLARDAVLAAGTKDDAGALARMLALVEAPEAVVPMLELQLGSKAQVIAAEWLSAHPLAAAVGLVPAARGQGKLADAARERLHTMRRSGLQASLTAALSHLTPEQSTWLTQEILDVAEETLPELGRAELPAALQAALAQVKAAKPPGWLSVASLPPIKLKGKRLAAAEVETVLAALKATALGAGSTLVSSLKQEADRTSLDAFAWKLFDLWQGMGAPSKDRWAMAAIGHLGGDACVLKLTPMLRDWPGESQHTRAVFGLECLRAIGSDTALTALNGIAQKLKFKGLKQKAQEMMEGIAQARGLTREQLADRVVPDCGLDARGSRAFDFGPRQFRFVLGPDMKPLVRDAGRQGQGGPAGADQGGRARQGRGGGGGVEAPEENAARGAEDPGRAAGRRDDHRAPLDSGRVRHAPRQASPHGQPRAPTGAGRL